jgi:hypothetical protein
VREAVAVARAAGVELDRAAMIATIWRTAERLAMAAFVDRRRTLVRAKPTEIDMLNGEVVRRGEALGVPVPGQPRAARAGRGCAKAATTSRLTHGARCATVRPWRAPPTRPVRPSRPIWSRTASRGASDARSCS